ncbi:MAG: hypothetical protein IJ252_02350 [Solobacterium sp.]|nr:hypothetical protein [Solobacterium sp.]
MHNMPAMSEEEKKQILKIVNENDYKKFLKGKKVDAKAVYSAFQKVGMNSVPLGNFRSYVKDHIYDVDDTFVAIYLELIETKLEKTVPSWDEITDIINDRQYRELSKEDLDKLEEYREAYEKADLPISYDRMIVYCCITPMSQYREAMEEKYKDQLQELKEALETEKKNHAETRKLLNEETRNSKKLTRELEHNKAEMERYESMLSVDSAVIRLSELLGIKDVNPDPKVLIESLNKLEVGSLNRQDYNRYMEILAAKYALAKVLEESK